MTKPWWLKLKFLTLLHSTKSSEAKPNQTTSNYLLHHQTTHSTIKLLHQSIKLLRNISESNNKKQVSGSFLHTNVSITIIHRCFLSTHAFNTYIFMVERNGRGLDHTHVWPRSISDFDLSEKLLSWFTEAVELFSYPASWAITRYPKLREPYLRLNSQQVGPSLSDVDMGCLA